MSPLLVPCASNTRVIGTRSQKSIIHQSLELVKKLRSKKISPITETLSSNDAYNTVPRYSGETDLYPFLRICDKVLESIEDNLTGKAFNALKHREINE
jgi:hypothetical protein